MHTLLHPKVPRLRASIDSSSYHGFIYVNTCMCVGRLSGVALKTRCMVVRVQAQDLVVQHFSCGSWETYFRLSSPGYGMAMG